MVRKYLYRAIQVNGQGVVITGCDTGIYGIYLYRGTMWSGNTCIEPYKSTARGWSSRAVTQVGSFLVLPAEYISA